MQLTELVPEPRVPRVNHPGRDAPGRVRCTASPALRTEANAVLPAPVPGQPRGAGAVRPEVADPWPQPAVPGRRGQGRARTHLRGAPAAAPPSGTKVCGAARDGEVGRPRGARPAARRAPPPAPALTWGGGRGGPPARGSRPPAASCAAAAAAARPPGTERLPGSPARSGAQPRLRGQHGAPTRGGGERSRLLAPGGHGARRGAGGGVCGGGCMCGESRLPPPRLPRSFLPSFPASPAQPSLCWRF